MSNVLFFLPTFSSGGAEAFVVNVVEELEKRGYRCCILSIDGIKSVYDARLELAGVVRKQLFERKIENPMIRYLRAYFKFYLFMKSSCVNFDVVHFNVAQGEELPFVWMAKRFGIPIRILHSHSSSASSLVKIVGHRLCKLFFSQVATQYFACSDTAANWLLPERVVSSGSFKIINNGIKIEHFQFNEYKRCEARRELGIDSERCYISVGRLSEEKNHKFLLRVFKRIVDMDPEAMLLLVGDGPLREPLRALAESLGICGSIRWLGVRKDVDYLLSASDCFLLPSLYEGFPFSLIEAQTAGLPCVVSNHVSPQCAITNLLDYVPLDIDKFAQAAMKSIRYDSGERISYSSRVQQAGYDIVSTVDKLEEYYLGAR